MPRTDETPTAEAVTQELADALFAAFESGTPIDPPTSTHEGFDVAAAYAVQGALVARHRDAGRTVAGHKVGLTSLAMQQQLGVDEPDLGVVLDSHVWSSGTTLDPAGLRMIAPRVEPEIAFVLDRELRGGVSRDEVLAATRSIVPIFEVIDSRVRDWKITLPDTIADNASGFGTVLGTPVPIADVGPLEEIEVQMRRGDEVLGSATGAAVLGHPAEAVAWLAKTLDGFGGSIPAGVPVLAGSFTAAVPTEPGTYVASFSHGVGDVSVTIGATA